VVNLNARHPDALAAQRSDGSIGVRLENPDQATSWREHHRAHCRLSIVPVEADGTACEGLIG
jgi:hypothetical protein